MSKEWNWELNKQNIWLKPSIESYFYVNLWKEKGYKQILDLGCGLGRHSILFAKNEYEVSALDLSKYAVDHLEKWAKEENVLVKTEVGDMLNLPYSDDAFDAIFSYHTISHTDTCGFIKIIEEIKRVLKPEGEIFLTLCSKDTWSFKESGYPKLDENTVIKKEDGPENDIPHFYVDLDDIYKYFQDFEILSLRHIDDIYYTDKVNHSKHYFIYAKVK